MHKTEKRQTNERLEIFFLEVLGAIELQLSWLFLLLMYKLQNNGV